MWIVRLALRRPYTFVVMAMLIAMLGVVTIVRMPTDIFPEIDIPVIAVVWNYVGISPDEMETRIAGNFERVCVSTVNNIEHIESQSLNGISVIKIFLQPGAKIETATAQIAATAQTVLRGMPPGTFPPLVLQYSASNVPILQASMGSDSLNEKQLFDLATNVFRPDMATVPGAQIPYPYGGTLRQIMIDIDPEKLYAWKLSAADVSNSLNVQNLILPSGTAKIGFQEYNVRLNSSPTVVEQIRDLPIKSVGNRTIFIRDVANVRDGNAPQTNIVHVNGKRGVMQPILKSGASTLDIVSGVKKRWPVTQTKMPGALKLDFIADQSLFVRASVDGVVREGLIAAGLTAAMILLFLGSWRSTLIVIISIPLSILVSIIILNYLGQTLNVMTLGGMALAVGILVDDATVEIENIHRNLHQRKHLVEAILDGAQQIAVPAFVSTLCICIVFVPVMFIAGAAKSLFIPLAMAVVFAMLTSYFLSRTLVPTMVHYLLAKEVAMYGGVAEEGEGESDEQFEAARRRRPTRRTPVAILVHLLAIPRREPGPAFLAGRVVFFQGQQRQGVPHEPGLHRLGVRRREDGLAQRAPHGLPHDLLGQLQLPRAIWTRYDHLHGWLSRPPTTREPGGCTRCYRVEGRA